MAENWWCKCTTCTPQFGAYVNIARAGIAQPPQVIGLISGVWLCAQLSQQCNQKVKEKAFSTVRQIEKDWLVKKVTSLRSKNLKTATLLVIFFLQSLFRLILWQQLNQKFDQEFPSRIEIRQSKYMAVVHFGKIITFYLVLQ